MPPATFHNIMLLHGLILGQDNVVKAKPTPAKTTGKGQSAAATTAAATPDNTQEFIYDFIQRDGFAFLATFFTQVDKSGLESSTLKTKALSMLIEMIAVFLQSKWFKHVKDLMSEQTVFDLFNQNLIVTQNYIVSVELQQRQQRAATGTRLLMNDTHLISISLSLMQKLMFLYQRLMRVFSEFPKINQVIEIAFIKLRNERIQAKFAQCFLDICKKLDHDLIKLLAPQGGSDGQAAQAEESK